MKKFRRAIEIIEIYGTRYLFSLIVNAVIRRLGLLDMKQIIKERASIDAKHLFQNKVAYGPFKGMMISDNVWWGKHDVLAKYLGEYEPHITEKLIELSRNYNHFIDIGAADGYYAIGLLCSESYESVTCFEISGKGRSTILENALLNSKKERLKILGEANAESISKELKSCGPSVVLCDIEGAEFTLLNRNFLQAIKDCTVIIELHDDVISGPPNRRKNLIKNANEFFNVDFIDRKAPKIFEFEEIRSWNDDLRLLAFSEDRPVQMDWLVLTPKEHL